MPVSTLTGVGELGCAAPMEPPPGPGFVPTSTDAGVVWQSACVVGAPIADLALANGVLTVTINGVSVTVPLAGEAVTDVFGVGLGYFAAK